MKMHSFNPYLNHYSYHLFFMNLANPLKIGILLSLREKEKSVKEIENDLYMEQSKISHALASLRKCNIVKTKKKGKSRVYYLNKKTVIPMLNLLDKHVSLNCPNGCNSCMNCKCEECS